MPAERLDVQSTDREGETVLRFEGALDARASENLRSLIDATVAARRRRVTVDLSSLGLIDSSGVGVIVTLFRRVRAQGGGFRVVGARDQPLAIFRLLALDRVIRLEPGTEGVDKDPEDRRGAAPARTAASR